MLVVATNQVVQPSCANNENSESLQNGDPRLLYKKQNQK